MTKLLLPALAAGAAMLATMTLPPLVQRATAQNGAPFRLREARQARAGAEAAGAARIVRRPGRLRIIPTAT